jgi:cell wall-associated NlpC family hydrolase
LVLAEQFGITQPSFVDDYASPDEVEIVSSLVAGGVPENGWHKVDGYGPRPGDGVVLRILNAPWHVGIMVNPDEFLHVSEGMEAGSVIDRLSSHRWARRVIGVFRHESLA